MAAAAERAGRICMVGFQALHGADIGFVKERVVSGRIGAVKSLACQAGWPRDRAYYARNDWAGRLKVGEAWVLDGPATNALAHQVANMLYLASPEPLRLAVPTAVRAELYAAGPAESHDTAAIEIRTREGATAYWIGSHCSQTTFGPVIDIEAERARVVWSMGGGATVTYEDGSQEVCPGDRGGAQDQMVADFVAAIRADDASGLAGRVADVRPFVLAIDGAHESSGRIHRIGAAHSHRVGEGTDEARTVVARIDEAITCAAEERRLFSDLSDAPPWAVATEGFDLGGYRAFPVRFAC